MKILYAFQGTGNGHIARAQEIIPILKKNARVDTLMSGHQSQLKSDLSINFQYRGISLLYNKNGGISYRKTFFENNFVDAYRTIGQLNLDAYDLIINDFEPLTAWACRFQVRPILELSHQASLSFAETPKPKIFDPISKLILKKYSPVRDKIGFHFENYHSKIKKPVIRQKIRSLEPQKKGFYLVYLPSFLDQNIIDILKHIPVQWKIFSKHTKVYLRKENIEVYPIDELEFLNAFENCEGLLCNAGFEGPAEALFLQKKLFVIPIHHQYEQECNAYALELLGINTSKTLNLQDVTDWVASSKYLAVDYPNDIEEIIINEVLTF